MRIRTLVLAVLAAPLLHACGGGAHAAPLPGTGVAGDQSTARTTTTSAAVVKPLRIGAAGPHALGAKSLMRRAQAVAAGPANITTADMPLPHPATTPCVVNLFSGMTFSDYSPHPYTFTPPAACPKPWAKVILNANLSVTAGVQYDRTATIGLAGATIFFGTTAEPTSSLGPTWHIQRDLTDLSALFAAPASGQVSIGNTVTSQYTGVIGASAQLLFYPPDAQAPAPRVADVVVPLADTNGNPVALASTSSQLTNAFVPPTNVEAAFLDVIAQSQIDDEFWYTCFPDQLATALDNCGNTAFRETEVAVDGRPAGVAPVYPWIFTGGIDPYLWQPIPGVQTLNFVPYRVDISPFAGTLDNGASHTIALSVDNADNYFSVTGNLLLFLDNGARAPLTGAIDSDNLATLPGVSISTTGHLNSSDIGSGTISTQSSHDYAITGHVNTSHGLVRSGVAAKIAFSNVQKVISSATEFAQDITQRTQIESVSAIEGSDVLISQTSTFDWPFTLDYAYVVNADGSGSQASTVSQGYVANVTRIDAAHNTFTSRLSNTVAPGDILLFDSSGNLSGLTNTRSSQVYTYRDSSGACYGKTITSVNNAVTGNVSTGC